MADGCHVVNHKITESQQKIKFLAERYYLTFGLCHEPFVCLEAET